MTREDFELLKKMEFENINKVASIMNDINDEEKLFIDTTVVKSKEDIFKVINQVQTEIDLMNLAKKLSDKKTEEEFDKLIIKQFELIALSEILLDKINSNRYRNFYKVIFLCITKSVNLKELIKNKLEELVAKEIDKG